MAESFVLDSFALLALLGREPGSDVVAGLLRQAQGGETRLLTTWVNVGEVAYIVERRWGVGRLHAALAMVEATELEMVPVERELARRVAVMRQFVVVRVMAHAKQMAAIARDAAGHWNPQKEKGNE